MSLLFSGQMITRVLVVATFFIGLNATTNAFSIQKSSLEYMSTSQWLSSRGAICFSTSASSSFTGCTLVFQAESSLWYYDVTPPPCVALPTTTSIPFFTRSYLIMGKGDGKKKKPKKTKAPTVSEPAAAVTESKPLPQRVSTEINIPVRHQIRWGQMKKAIAKSSSPSFRQAKVVRTKYRRSWGELLYILDSSFSGLLLTFDTCHESFLSTKTFLSFRFQFMTKSLFCIIFFLFR
jgi:hypothetical protein